jgi:hypothetical protein
VDLMKKVRALGRKATSNSIDKTTGKVSEKAFCGPFKCILCNYCSKSVYCLRDHILHKHSKGQKVEGEIENNQCRLCKLQGTAVVMIGHMLTTHLDKEKHATFILKEDELTEYLSRLRSSGKRLCDTCGYAAASKSALDEHTKSVHFHIKEHVCEVCGHATHTPASLKLHMVRRHAGTGFTK